jgi:ATP-dependent protease ClpP protease subunit
MMSKQKHPKPTPKKMKLIEIENKAGSVSLNDGVNKESIDQILMEIGMIYGASAAEAGGYMGDLTNDATNAADSLTIKINSQGGSVFDGGRLYNAISELRARGVFVTAFIDNLAASMGSVVAMAADKIVMVKNGRMMIHEVSAGIRGTSKEIMQVAELCREMTAEIANIYSDRTGIPIDDIYKMLADETWLNSSRALELKFIDEIYNPTAKTTLDNLSEIITNSSMFFKNRNEVDSYKADLEKFKADSEALTNKLVELEAVLDASKDEFSTELEAKAKEALDLSNKVTELEASLSASKAEIANLTAQVEITEEKIGLAASRLLASHGHSKPVNMGKQTITENLDNIKTMAEYNAMGPKDRLAFVKTGGKFIDQ